MSHLKERKEKDCLNCQTTVVGRYCHVCGQENLEPKETVWHLVQHFFNDITHFDGKFFSTVKFLLRKPGFLSAEYVAGRRASYLNPIRMYVFTSAIFFIILYSISKPEEIFRKQQAERMRGLPELEKRLSERQKELKVTGDADDRDDIQSGVDQLGMEIREIKKEFGDSTTRKFTDKELTGLMITALTDSLQEEGVPPATKSRVKQLLVLANHPMSGSNLFGMNQGQYNTVEEYDSTERALPDSLRDGWLKRTLMRKLIAAGEEYQRDPQRYKEKFWENWLHSFPKILFWSLPFFALILNILYFRHKKQFYYVDHGIFAIHLYIATFLLLLICMLLSILTDWVGVHWLQIVTDILITLVCIYNFIYLYKAMRGFYRQRRAKTFLKYFIVCGLAFIINLILFLIFTILSAINI
ncbi:MAG TPA: DUF3667 domain-containing protein [Puia sp.]|nr:DUF3667 domain-containing protein [Puia sp.]